MIKDDKIIVLANDVLAYLEKLKHDLRRGLAGALASSPFELMSEYGEGLKGHAGTLLVEVDLLIKGEESSSTQKCLKEAKHVVEYYDALRAAAITAKKRLLALRDNILEELEEAKHVYVDIEGMAAELENIMSKSRKEYIITRDLVKFFKKERRYLGAEAREAKQLQGHVEEITGLVDLMTAFLTDIIKHISVGASLDPLAGEGAPLISKNTLDKIEADIAAMGLDAKIKTGPGDIRLNAKTELRNLWLTFVSMTTKMYDDKVKGDLKTCDDNKQRAERLIDNIHDEIVHFEREHSAEMAFLKRKIEGK